MATIYPELISKEQKEAVLAVLKQAWKMIRGAAENLLEALKTALNVIEKEPEIKKYKGIYTRTKSKRIRKKQLTKINEIIRRKNGYIKSK